MRSLAQFIVGGSLILKPAIEALSVLFRARVIAVLRPESDVFNSATSGLTFEAIVYSQINNDMRNLIANSHYKYVHLHL